MYLYVEQSNKYFKFNGTNLDLVAEPSRSETLLISTTSVNINKLSFKNSKLFYKYFDKLNLSKPSVFFKLNETDYLIFSEEKNIIGGLYDQFSVYPVPYQIIFLNYCKKNELTGINIFVEKDVTSAEDNPSIITTIISDDLVQTFNSNLKAFNNLIVNKINSIRKNEEKVVLYSLDHKLVNSIPAFSNVEYVETKSMYVSSEVEEYYYENPTRIASSAKSKDIKEGARILLIPGIILMLTLVLSYLISNNIKKYSNYNMQMNASNVRIKKKLRIYTGKLYPIVLENKNPNYSAVIKKILLKFPKDAYLKNITMKNNNILISGYTVNSYEIFTKVVNELSHRLNNINKLSAMFNDKGKPSFLIEVKNNK